MATTLLWFLFLVLIKHNDQKRLGEERVYLAGSLQQILRETRTGTAGRNRSGSHGGMLLTGFLSMLSLSIQEFLPMDPWMTPPIVPGPSHTYHQQGSISQACLQAHPMEDIPQLRFFLFGLLKFA